MAGLLDRASAVVGRYGRTVDKFTGDGGDGRLRRPWPSKTMRCARAGLPWRSTPRSSIWSTRCLHRDGIDLRLRVGLNSGQVIAGEIGSRGRGYTTIGEQVGMAQRMESSPLPGRVMLSPPPLGLVEPLMSLGDPELVQIRDHSNRLSPNPRLLGVPTATIRRGRALDPGRSTAELVRSRICCSMRRNVTVRWSPWWARRVSARAV